MNFVKTFIAGLLAFMAGSIVMFFLFIFIITGIIAGIGGSMDKPVLVPAGSVLKIDFSETITDAPVADPFAGLDFLSMNYTGQLSLLKVLRAIEAARDDERIEGIYLRMNGEGGVTGTALLEELRAALVDFKQSGKFVVSYNETYSQGSYYLASAADKIYLQPEGLMDWSGLSFDMMFYKGLLDKLDVQVEVFRPTVCKFKSAVEPYILDKMSDANRVQMQELANSMWRTLAGEVAAARGIDFDKLNTMTDNLEVYLPEEALEKGFVDGLIYEDRMNGIFAELGVDAGEDAQPHFVTLGEYASQVSMDVDNLLADQVAVVYADGGIVDGEGSGAEVFGNTLAAELAEVRADDKVKAVVLRVNSPGGSALASDVIWREMELLKAEKPVVVSMGSYAASGGYYISAPADVIVADKLTLTGSIGVFGMFFDTHAALKNKLGITVDGVKSNKSAGMGASQSLKPVERAMLMRGVDKVYATFTNLVSQGRNLPIERVLEVAEGRVWSGEEALGIGLIDAYGGLKSAIAIAAEKAELGENFRVVEKLGETEGFMSLFSSLNARVSESIIRSNLGMAFDEYRHMQQAVSQQGIVMYSPYRIEL